MADTLVLNPTTPMAYLPPWMADVTTFASYVIVGVVGAVVWDIAIHIDRDFKLLFKRTLSIKTGVYFLSRECTLIFALLNAILQTSPMDGCRIMQNVLLSFYYISAAPTALLAYLLTCRNIKSKTAMALLFIPWLSVLAGAIVLTLNVTNGFQIGQSGYCSYGFVKISSGVAPATFAFHNTVLFLVNARTQTLDFDEEYAGIATTRRQRLSHFALRSGYDDGQVFFLISVLLNWAAVIVCFVRINPPSLWWSILTLNVAVSNMLFCRVHRIATIDVPTNRSLHICNSKRRTETSEAPMTFADPATLSKGGVEDSVRTRRDDDSDDSSIFGEERPRIYRKAFPGFPGV